MRTETATGSDRGLFCEAVQEASPRLRQRGKSSLPVPRGADKPYRLRNGVCPECAPVIVPDARPKSTTGALVHMDDFAVPDRSRSCRVSVPLLSRAVRLLTNS